MSTGLLLLIITVAVALTFDFLNGFHDAANSIATVVSTRVLSPKLAVIWAAFFNFVAAFLLGTAVAKTIGKGMIRLDDVTQYVVIAGLAGAIVWDLLTWWWGLPTSSSHALIGGYAGAAMARAALNHGIAHAYSVILPHGWTLTLIFIVILKNMLKFRSIVMNCSRKLSMILSIIRLSPLKNTFGIIIEILIFLRYKMLININWKNIRHRSTIIQY